MAALPAELRERAGRVAGRFHLDAPSWYRAADSSPHLVAVADAVRKERAICIHYLRWAKPQEITRVVEPYGLVLKAGRWYLVAAAGSATRTYRVSRILDVQPLDVTFERDPGFDLASYWQQYLRSFDERRHAGHAVVRMSPDALARLPEVAELSVADAARRSAEPDGQGWLRVTIPVEEPSQALSELFRLAPHIEILSPHHLRAQMIETLQTLNRLYTTRTRPGPYASAPADPAPPQGSPD
jgi:predicted DNA-binding transcriptional regulator YafY